MATRDRRDENAEDQRPGRETTMAKWIGMTIAPAVTGRFRSLEGRPLSMSCSALLPESARLRLLALGSSFVTALAEQRQPMTGLLISQPTRRWWEALQEFEGVVRLVKPGASGRSSASSTREEGGEG
jgi:hypothetical protein